MYFVSLLQNVYHVYRIVKRHLKITTTSDKVTVDAYHNVESHGFSDYTPTAVNNTVGESNNMSSNGDKDEEVLAADEQRNDNVKSFLLLLVFGICAGIYGSMSFGGVMWSLFFMEFISVEFNEKWGAKKTAGIITNLFYFLFSVSIFQLPISALQLHWLYCRNQQ